MWGTLAALALAAAAPTQLTLEQAWKLADQSSPDLAMAAERVEQSDLDVRSAWAGFLPQIGAQGSYLWYNEKIYITGFGAVPLPTPGILFQDSPVYQGQVQGTWPIVNAQAWPALAAARHGAAATADAREGARRELRFAVAQAFFAAIATDNLVKAADEGVANSEELSRVAGEQVKAQTVTKLALLRAEAEVERAKQQAISARGAHGSALAALSRLTGVDGPIEAIAPEPAPQDPIADDSTLWATAEARRADLASAAEAAAARETLARWRVSTYVPTVAGQGTWYYTSNSGLTGHHDGGTLGFVASWQLFDGGLREAKNARTASQWREARANLESVRRRARAEVQQAALDLATARAALDAARKQAALAREARELAKNQYQAGTATNLEVTQANATLFLAEAGLAQAEAQAAIADLALKKAIGTL